MTFGADYFYQGWENLLDRLLQSDAQFRGSRAGVVDNEFIGASLYLAVGHHKKPFLMNEKRRISPRYQAGEMLQFLIGSDDGYFLEPVAPNFLQYCENGGRQYGAWGARLENQGNSSILRAIELLQKDPGSRRIVMSLWNTNDLFMGQDKKDVPCCTQIQLLLRDGLLHFIVSIRSSDVWLGLPNDYFTLAHLQMMLARDLHCGTGSFQINFGSLHLYSRYVEKAEQALGHSESIEIDVNHIPTYTRARDFAFKYVNSNACANTEYYGCCFVSDWWKMYKASSLALTHRHNIKLLEAYDNG